MRWLICALYMATFSGIAYVMLRAVFSGAEVYSGTYSETTARQFEDVFLFIPARRIAEAGWAAAAASFIVIFLVTGSFTSVAGAGTGIGLGAIAAALALRSPRALLTILRKRRRQRFESQLVDTLINMSNALKAGFSISQAFESVVKTGQNPISQEFDVFLQQTRVGVSFSEALDNLDRRVGSDDLTLVVLSIESARRTGGNLTEIFEKISSTIRERMRIENRIRTLTAQGRLQGIVVGVMPIVIVFLMIVVDSAMMLTFMHSTVGVVVMGVVVMLILMGALVIRKIINIDV